MHFGMTRTLIFLMSSVKVKIWFQNRRMKWRNSKERELLSTGGCRQQTLPTKSNPHPDLTDVGGAYCQGTVVGGEGKVHLDLKTQNHSGQVLLGAQESHHDLHHHHHHHHDLSSLSESSKQSDFSESEDEEITVS